MIQPTTSPLLSLSVSKVLHAPPERVFRAWTTAAELKRWFAVDTDYTIPLTEVDFRIGGRYRLGMQGPNRAQPSVATGVYEEITPPSRLVFTWRWEDAGPDYPTTRVTVEFRPHPAGTELILVHDGFSDPAEREQHAAGWQGCLSLLEQYLSENEANSK